MVIQQLKNFPARDIPQSNNIFHITFCFMQDLKRKFMSVETEPSRSPAILSSVMPSFRNFLYPGESNQFTPGRGGGGGLIKTARISMEHRTKGQ